MKAREGTRGHKAKGKGGEGVERKSEYGHRKMIVWQNIDRLDAMFQRNILPKIPAHCFQLRDQMDRACGSVAANFIEGYYSGSLKEYLRFLGYSKRSLAELQDWVRRSFHKTYLPEANYYEFDDLLIKTLFLLNRLINALKDKASKDKSLKP
jgi:four helix bundle protein